MRLRVKICGVTSPDQARAAAELGADAVGVILAPESPRCVEPARAAAIAAALPPFVTRVAVLVNEEPADAARRARQIGFDVLQFHGDETPESCARSSLPWYKAHRVAPGFDVRSLDAYGCAVHLLDGWDAARRGGTGAGVDRRAAAAAARRHRIILAGGLRPDNVVEAVEAVRPAAVDVNSGVESAPGVKDPRLLQDLFARLRAAGVLG